VPRAPPARGCRAAFAADAAPQGLSVDERLHTPTRGVAESVQELARTVVCALDDEAPLDVMTGTDDPVLSAAARVLGADVLAPSTLSGRDATESEVALLSGAVRAEE